MVFTVAFLADFMEEGMSPVLERLVGSKDSDVLMEFEDVGSRFRFSEVERGLKMMMYDTAGGFMVWHAWRMRSGDLAALA